MDGCKINTCDKFVPSMCVLYTGKLHSNTPFTIGCNDSLNDLIYQIDEKIIALLSEYGIKLLDIKNANQCQIDEINELGLNSTYQIDIQTAKTTSTVLQLIKVICDQEARISKLEEECCWDSTLVNIDLHCLSKIYDDPCTGQATEIKTYRDLLQALIVKLCQ